MECRPGCGACCIAPSISSPIPGMPQGKLAGEICVQLDAQFGCKIFGQPERPQVCADFKACESVCGSDREDALNIITLLEQDTL